jgi:PH (Pleckstrin Homology) domain-containing protein
MAVDAQATVPDGLTLGAPASRSMLLGLKVKSPLCRINAAFHPGPERRIYAAAAWEKRPRMKHYKAPWGTSLVVISSFAMVLCLGAALGLVRQGRGWLQWMALVPLSLVVGSALFTVRGYSVAPDVILIHRLFWSTRLPLAGLESAQFEPGAMRRSLRTFGNGGLFSFTGWFYNKALGAYRAFVTDPRRTVVLHYPGRTVILSPAAPEKFVLDLPLSGHPA